MSLVIWGYKAGTESFIEKSLETTEAYAKKVSFTTNNFFINAFQVLEYSATTIAEKREDEQFMMNEADRLFSQMGLFNSVIVVSEGGKIIASSSLITDIIGGQVNSDEAQQILAKRVPSISKPYITQKENLSIFVSHPIFDRDGNYRGYVGGTIYLLEDNALNKVLNAHFHDDDSYIYVVDAEGRIISHPSLEKVNQLARESQSVKATMDGESGAQRLVDYDGVDRITGYAYIPIPNWGIVIERDTKLSLQPMVKMRQAMIINTLPFILISFLIIVFVSSRIAKPLNQLSYYAEMSMQKNANKKTKEIQEINVWYYEAIQLKKAIMNSFALLEGRVSYFISKSETDSLTGLRNRSFVDECIEKWEKDNDSYSIIMLDIDRFKRVNDTYGHSVGDEVLKFLANEMQLVVGEEGVCCRYGGEEFVILLAKTEYDRAFYLAEQLRKKLEVTVSPCGEVITISSGVAHYPTCANHPVKLFEVVDERLYKAKNGGRNRTIGRE